MNELNIKQMTKVYKDYDPFGIAWNMTEEAPCVKKQVGSALFGLHKNDNESISMFVGYGGVSVRKGPYCEKDENGLCPRKTMTWAQDGCWAIHSEQRALLQALMLGVCVPDGPDNYDLKAIHPETYYWIMFVTHGPCDQCIKFMHHFAVDLCVYDIEYKTDYSKWDGMIKIIQREKFERAVREKTENTGEVNG